MSQISLDEYQLITRETSGCDELPILALGLLGETIELLDSLTSTDSGKIIKEAGDIIWYSARIADVFEVKFSDPSFEYQTRSSPLSVLEAATTSRSPSPSMSATRTSRAVRRLESMVFLVKLSDPSF